jgi:hypothetical protein
MRSLVFINGFGRSTSPLISATNKQYIHAVLF